MKSIKYGVFAGFLIFIIGCQRTPTTPNVPDTLVINMLLSSDTPFQKAMVSRVLGNKDFGDIYSNDAFVSLNHVRLYNQPKTELLVEKRVFNVNSDYNYYHPDFNVIAGETYTLNVVTADSDTVIGITTVPDHVEFGLEVGQPPFKTTHSKGSPIDIPVLQWNDSGNAYMYIVNIYKRGVGVERIPVSTGNIVFTHEFKLSESNFNPKVQYIYELIQFDQNYYEYIVQKKNSAGITGARGVFGSYTVDTAVYNPPKE